MREQRRRRRIAHPLAIAAVHRDDVIDDAPDHRRAADVAKLFGGGIDEQHDPAAVDQQRGNRVRLRSEEHTSELQSLMRISYAVFCLKKKKKTKKIKHTHKKMRATNTHINLSNKNSTKHTPIRQKWTHNINHSI